MKNYYLLHLKFNGLRFHGVQKQPNFITLSSHLENHFKALYPNTNFSFIFSSRLDAKVSSSSLYVQILTEEIWNEDDLISLQSNLNKKMHDNIYIYSIKRTPKFHLQNYIEEKTYQYTFTNQNELMSDHITYFSDLKDLELVKKAATLFVNEINIHPFSFRSKENQINTRKIYAAAIYEQTPGIYVFEVRARGFVRGQVRMMMGALVKLSSSQITIAEFKDALHSNQKKKLGFMVPAQGLSLVETKLKNLHALK